MTVKSKLVKLPLSPKVEEAAAPSRSEMAIGDEFIRRHGANVRFVSKWGRWYIWDGKRWAEDESLKIFSMAAQVCREIAITSNKPNKGQSIASARKRDHAV